MSNKSSLKDTLAGTYHAVEEKVDDVLYDAWHIRLHKHARRHLHKLRKRPNHHKDIISFFAAFLVTLVVFIGWYFISFPKIIESYKMIRKENSALDISSNPIENIKNTLNTQSPNIEVE